MNFPTTEPSDYGYANGLTDRRSNPRPTAVQLPTDAATANRNMIKVNDVMILSYIN
jgi:hypothetical protein